MGTDRFGDEYEIPIDTKAVDRMGLFGTSRYDLAPDPMLMNPAEREADRIRAKADWDATAIHYWCVVKPPVDISAEAGSLRKALLKRGWTEQDVTCLGQALVAADGLLSPHRA
jgi:hypothetical protein